MNPITLEGQIGKIIFYPATNIEYRLFELERRLQKILSEDKVNNGIGIDENDYVDADTVIAELKKNNPFIGTPGGAIKSYRAREGLTQVQLAKKCKLRQSHLSEMERNKRPIGLKVAKKLAKVLKCDYRRLV